MKSKTFFGFTLILLALTATTLCTSCKKDEPTPPASKFDKALFVTKWQTDNVSSEITGKPKSTDKQIYFPGIGTDYTIMWEEVDNPSNKDTLTNITSTEGNPVLITFPAAGAYYVKVKPERFKQMYSGYVSSPYGDIDKLMEITQWGEVEWTSMLYAFFWCVNMNISAEAGKPNLTKVKNTYGMFERCRSLNQNINHWDVDSVNNMRKMFYECTAFNSPLDKWDVSTVTYIGSMFYKCTAFNQPLGGWKLNAVTDITRMLDDCGMSTANYSATLKGWAENTNTPNGLTLGAKGLKYSAEGKTAREKLTKAVSQGGKGWTIEGDSQEEF